MDPLKKNFYKARELMRIMAWKASVRAESWLRGDSRLEADFLPYITPTAPYSPAAQRLLDPYISSALLVVRGVQYAGAYAIGEPAQVVIPAGQIWDIIDVVGAAQMDGNAGNRTCQIQVLGHEVDPDNPGPIGPLVFQLTTGIVLTLGQYGGSILSSGMSPNLTTNTNGVLALVANENFIPQQLNAGAIISHENDNFAVGVADVVEIGVHYRRVT